MLGLLGVLIIGLIVGGIARLIVPGKEPGGCLVTIAIGVAGSFVAFYLGSLVGWNSGNPDSLRPVGFIPSLIGAVILLISRHIKNAFLWHYASVYKRAADSRNYSRCPLSQP